MGGGGAGVEVGAAAGVEVGALADVEAGTAAAAGPRVSTVTPLFVSSPPPCLAGLFFRALRARVVHLYQREREL